MKAIWKGSISFGLVNIPVVMHSAIQEHSFGFNMLCGKCHRKLTYFRWCSHCNKEVTWEEVVKGLPYKDSYIVLTKEDIKALKPKVLDVISIKEFVHQDEISSLYIENNYYLAPGKENNKAFFLLLEALRKANKVAIGQFVMHDKEHLVAISAYENILLLTSLHYSYEVRSLEQLAKIKKVKVTAEELTLATQLINKLSRKSFNLDKYKDTFVESLKKAINTARRGKKVKVAKSKKTTKTKETLRDSLRASLRQEARA